MPQHAQVISEQRRQFITQAGINYADAAQDWLWPKLVRQVELAEGVEAGRIMIPGRDWGMRKKQAEDMGARRGPGGRTELTYGRRFYQVEVDKDGYTMFIPEDQVNAENATFAGAVDPLQDAVNHLMEVVNGDIEIMVRDLLNDAVFWATSSPVTKFNAVGGDMVAFLDPLRAIIRRAMKKPKARQHLVMGSIVRDRLRQEPTMQDLLKATFGDLYANLGDDTTFTAGIGAYTGFGQNIHVGDTVVDDSVEGEAENRADVWGNFLWLGDLMPGMGPDRLAMATGLNLFWHRNREAYIKHNGEDGNLAGYNISVDFNLDLVRPDSNAGQHVSAPTS